MRLVATALLAAMVALFAATYFMPPGHAAEAVRAFAEAAVVGGLADWFAVTALFRRPLGLPIPHTAIIPARKNDIGRALARFIRDHFLVREAVLRRLESAELTKRFGTWLEDPNNSARVARDVAGAFDWMLRASDGGELRGALGAVLGDAFRAVPPSRALGTLVDVLTTGDRVHAVVDQLVQFARTALASHSVALRQRIHDQSPWWLPKFIDQEIYDKLVTAIEDLLEAIATQPDHPARAEIVARLATLKDSLVADDGLAAKSGALRDEITAHPAIRAYAHDLSQRVNEELHAALRDETSPLFRSLEREIGAFGTALRTDAALAQRLDERLRELLLHVVDRYRDPLSAIVSDTIDSWEPRATARRIELHLGRDLQFIRISGTLVGGLVGLGLYGLTRLLA
jgi:uncharacterized membrane-anchored protein YjiN (DUF445 family)